MSSERPVLLVILGPTAAGKTKVAVEIALLTGGEVISADSMSVYRYMDIGTAKPAPEERKGVPHHLIDIVFPNEEFSVAHYQSMAVAAIEDIYQRGNLPIMAGGTGLYINAVIDGYQFGPAGIDNILRERLWRYAREHGKQELHKRLEQVDPVTAARLHPNDIKRIIRALEIYEQTGRPMSARPPGDVNKPRFEARLYGLYMPREELYEKINIRVEEMLAQGLVNEVRFLLDKGYDPSLVSMQALGYKEIVAYLKGEISYEEAVYLIKRNTRRFAKRQLTWFRRDKRIKWLNVKEYHEAREIAREIIADAEGLIKRVSNH